MPAIKTNHKSRRLILLAAIAVSITPYLPLITGDADRLNFGRFIGLVGLQLIWWQIVLGNRLIVRFLTQDLLWVNKLHRLIGIYGFLLILLHPVLIIASYGLALVWPPSFASSFDIGVRLGMAALAFLSFTWVISALFRKKIPWRWWKRLHFLAYVVFPTLFLHMLLVGTSINQSRWVEVWLYGTIAVFWIIVLMRAMGWAGITKQHFTAIDTETVARDVTRFRLKPKSKGITPKPGQFAYLQAQRFGEEHPFTVSHYDAGSGEISFSIKAVGPYSRSLTRLEIGDIVYIDGPYGVFTEEMNSSDRSAVVIAGGIGITPFIRHLEAKNIRYLFWGCRTEADIAYRAVVEAPDVEAYIVLSEKSEQRPGYETGIITADLIKKRLEQPLTEYDFYLCGPQPMMKSLREELVSHHVLPEHIYQEKFSL